MQKIIEKELLALTDEWEKWAMEQVPDYYAKRNWHDKYLRGDNIAAGYSECADRLRDLLNTFGLTKRASDAKTAPLTPNS